MIESVVDIAAVASGAALAIVFLTCIAFSAWICFRMRKDEDGQWSAMKERWRRQRVRKRLVKNFKKESSYVKKKFMRTPRVNPGLPASVATQDLENACSVCLENYFGDPNEIMVGLLVPCRHYFHFECLWQWLENQTNCPICRKDVTLSDVDLKAVPFSYIVNCNLRSETGGLMENSHSVRMEDPLKRENSKPLMDPHGSHIFHTSASIIPTHVMPPVE